MVPKSRPNPPPPPARPDRWVFINPRLDWAFKRIFGSRESAHVLKCFLNDLLHGGKEVITSVVIENPYLPSQIHQMKDTAVDVRATLADDTEVLIEMQMYPVAGYCQRVLFNAAKRVTAQLKRGAAYTKLRPVIVLTIADCEILPDATSWLSTYTLKEKTSRRTYPGSGIELMFIELPRVTDEALTKLGPIADWLRFLKSAEKWRTVPRLVKNTAVREALDLARDANLNAQESDAMNARQLWKWDQINMRRHALDEGERLGIAKGEHRLIGNLLRTLSCAEVAKLTGVSLTTVRKVEATSAAASVIAPAAPRRTKKLVVE